MQILISKLKHINQRMRVFKDWYKVVFPFNRFGKGTGRLMKLRNGASVYIRNIFGSDFHTTLAVAGRDDYGLKSMNLPKDATIIDVGGNIGTFTLTAKALFPESKIYTFEPEHANFKALTENIRRNKSTNVYPQNEAISTEVGTLTLHVNSKETGSHSVIQGHTKDTEAQEITTTTLENVVRDHDIERIDLLKMDIEGAEYEIFFQMPKEILLKIQRITLEIHQHPKYSVSDLTSFFKGHGFTIRPSATSKRVFICER